MSEETIFLEGMIIKAPRPKAPAFVKGSISFKVDEFKAFLDNHNNNGWVNADLLESKGGKLYAKLNTYVKGEAKAKVEKEEPEGPEIEADDVPF